jgi:urease accessory protein UreF
MTKRMLIAAAATVALVLVVCGAAFAAEVSRDEYKEAAEPICQASAKANEGILAGVRQEVKKGQLKTAAAKFAKASKEQAQSLRKLEALPRPSADEARLTKWFSYLKIEAELFATAGRKLKAGDKADAQRVFAKLSQNINKANNQVLPFEFNYCRLNAAKLT